MTEEEIQKNSEHWYEKYKKQQEINKELVDENEQAKEIIKLLLWDLRNRSYEPVQDIEKAEHFLGRDA